MNLQEQLQQVNDIFVTKMLEGDFRILKIDEHHIMVEVEGYWFTFWMSNGKDRFECDSFEYNYMMLSFTDRNRKQIYNKLHGYYKWKQKELDE